MLVKRSTNFRKIFKNVTNCHLSTPLIFVFRNPSPDTSPADLYIRSPKHFFTSQLVEKNMDTVTIQKYTKFHGVCQGRTHGGPRVPAPPWDLKKNTIFSGFLPLNYVIWIFKVVFFLSFLLCGRTEEACSMVDSLRKVDFSHPTGHSTWKKSGPP